MDRCKRVNKQGGSQFLCLQLETAREEALHLECVFRMGRAVKSWLRNGSSLLRETWDPQGQTLWMFLHYVWSGSMSCWDSLFFYFPSPFLDHLSSPEYLLPKAFMKASSGTMLSNVYDLKESSLCHQMETRTFCGGRGKKKKMERYSEAELHLSYRKYVWCEEKKSSICCVPFSQRQMMAYQKEHHQRRCVNGESLVLLCAPDSWSRPSGEPVADCFCSCCIIYDN